MQSLMDSLTSMAVEIVVVVVGAFASMALVAVKKQLDILKKKDELGIVDLITDRVVELIEVEFKGAHGTHKRDMAVKMAVNLLADKGIHVNEKEVIAGIENGVNKLKDRPQSLISAGATLEEIDLKDLDYDLEK